MDHFIFRVKILFFIPVIFCTVSCKKNVDASDLQIISYSIKGQNAKVDISSAQSEIHVQFPETTTTATDLIAEFTLSPGATAFIQGTPQESGVTANNFEYLTIQYD